jgi:LytR cell envelope-related transcriptional attenuator/Tetratricopeptide repeat
MKRSRILASALAASVTVAGCSAFTARSGNADEPEVARAAPDAAPALDRGKAHFADGNYGLALQAFMGALAAQDDSVDALNAVGASYDRLGRHDLARKYYERALAVAPSHAQTLNNLGYSLVLQGNYDAALDYFRLAKTERMNPLLDANIAMAQRLAQRRQANLGAPIAAPQMAALPPAATAIRRDGPWLERTSPYVHTLMTKPRIEPQMAVLPRDTAPKVALAPQPAIPAELTHGFTLAPLVPQAPVTGAEIGVTDAPPVTLLPLDMIAAAPPSPAQPAPLPLSAAPPSPEPPLAAWEPPPAPVDEPAPAAPPAETLAPVVQLPDAPPPPLDATGEPRPAFGSITTPDAAGDFEEPMAAVVSDHPLPNDGLPPIVMANTEPSGELALHEWPSPDGGTVVGSQPAAKRGTPAIAAAPAPVFTDAPPRAEKAPRALADATPPAAANDRWASTNWPSDAQAGDPADAAAPAAANGLVLEISNGAGRERMATRFRSYLQVRGFANIRVSNDKTFRNNATVVFYREGYREAAELVARELPFPATVERADDQAAHVRVLLGSDFLDWDRRQLITGLALQGATDVAILN